jgi:hypothetical protein
MSRRYLLLVPLLSLTGCAEAIWRVDPATPPRRWASDSRTHHWPRPLDITYTFWTSGRVTADVTPAHQWWRHVYGTGWEVDVPDEPEDVTTIAFDGMVERYRRHYPGGEAIMTVIPSRKPQGIVQSATLSRPPTESRLTDRADAM